MRLRLLDGMSPNGRVTALSEPFWAIPFAMISVYATPYMLALGLTERQVGLAQTVLVATQLTSSLFSGTLTNVLGRRRTTLLFDTISWFMACVVWAIARNPAAFYLAAFLNGINRIVFVSFTCLLTEDASPDQRLRNYSGVHFMVLGGGLFAPVAGLLVSRIGLISGARTIYGVSAGVMLLMFILRHLAWTEPTKSAVIVKTSISVGIIDSLRYFFSHRSTRLAYLLQAIKQFMTIFKPLFLYAYLRDHLKLSDGIVSGIPPLLSVTTMILLVWVLPKVTPAARRGFLAGGLASGGISALLLVLVPRFGLGALALSVLADGVSAAFSRPLIDSLWADSLQDEKRAIQLGAGHLLTGIITVPAGALAAELYTRSPSMPFAVAAAIFGAAAILALALPRVPASV